MNDYGFYGSSEEHQPVTYVRGYPIYAAHFVVVVLVASMIATSILMFSNAAPLLDWLTFSSGQVLAGQAWRVVTYGLVNPPSLWFAVDMLMLVWFGREVEKFFGRRRFLVLYGCIYLLPALLFTALGTVLPTHLAGETGAFAIFVAFATLYPNAPLFFTLLAKWVALILVGLYTLMALAGHNWVMLLSLWATSAFAFGFVRHAQGRFELPRLRLPRRKPKLRVLPEVAPKTVRPAAAPDATMAEVDALLDKIAKSGFASLTPKERARLDAAREELRNRASR